MSTFDEQMDAILEAAFGAKCEGSAEVREAVEAYFLAFFGNLR